MVACVLAVGCAGHRESARAPVAAQERCILRITKRGTYADGEPMSRDEAVAYCKRARNGAVIVIEDERKTDWDATAHTLVVHEDKVIEHEWNETRSALEREGVPFYVRGSLCDRPDARDCWPRVPAGPMLPPRRELPPVSK